MSMISFVVNNIQMYFGYCEFPFDMLFFVVINIVSTSYLSISDYNLWFNLLILVLFFKFLFCRMEDTR
jgi:hypothetical protein